MDYFKSGWKKFETDPKTLAWAQAARTPGLATAANPDLFDAWLRCNGTWFVGVNALPNDATGRLPGGPALAGEAIEFIHQHLAGSDVVWDRAQVSVCYRGYPQKGNESDAAFRFRRDRFAAHVDGLLPIGPNRRRHLREFHRFVLGLPLTQSPPQAAPFVIWEGSHLLVQTMFAQLFSGYDAKDWPEIDLTDAYQSTRKMILERCQPVTLPASPGEAYLIHRHALHGVAPWDTDLMGPAEGRAIAYFRPEFSAPSDWLSDD